MSLTGDLLVLVGSTGIMVGSMIQAREAYRQAYKTEWDTGRPGVEAEVERLRQKREERIRGEKEQEERDKQAEHEDEKYVLNDIETETLAAFLRLITGGPEPLPDPDEPLIKYPANVARRALKRVFWAWIFIVIGATSAAVGSGLLVLDSL